MNERMELPNGYCVTSISGHGIDGVRYYWTRLGEDNPMVDVTLIGKAPPSKTLHPSRASAASEAWDDALDRMCSEIVKQADYDIWKDVYGEEPEDVEGAASTRAQLRETARRHM